LLVRGTRYFVTEADEFDRSFLHLQPAYAAITSLDADHLDIYGDEASMHQAYADFAALVSRKLVYHAAAPLALPAGVPTQAYGPGASVHAANIRIENGHFVFDYIGSETIFDIVCGMPGLHNIENAVAAITLVLEIGLRADDIRQGMASFKGVKRRFETVYRSVNKVFIDDYAHHPTEIAALLASVRTLYPGKKVLGIFQPHLFSRTRDFMAGFAETLSALDQCWLLDIYPARELPMPGIDSAALLAKIAGEKRLISKENLLPALAAAEYDVLLTIGAGDIDRLVGPIAQQLKQQEGAA
jgi:UDP-N-acetylmuramate--alanine ligase